MKCHDYSKVSLNKMQLSGTTPRCVESLKQKYEGLKKELKKKIRKNKEETYKTGGGIPNYEPINDLEKKLLEIISTQVHGLWNSIDSDSSLAQTGNQQIIVLVFVTSSLFCRHYWCRNFKDKSEEEQQVSTYFIVYITYLKRKEISAL